MPDDNIDILTLKLPKDLNDRLHQKLYHQYPKARPSFNTFLVQILQSWVVQQKTL